MQEISPLIYGVIQGVSEFLPISSSGHLALLPHFLGIKDPGVIFDLSMHVGTALAVVVYFCRDIKVLVKQVLVLFKGLLKEGIVNEKCAWAFNLIIATLTSVLFILVLKSLAFEYGRTPFSMVITLSSFGVLMLLSDSCKKDHDELYMDKIQLKKSFFIGLFQSFAIFPGVSRSGSTLTISRYLGLGREESTRFSFLLSIPIIAAGFLYKVPTIFRGDIEFDMSALCVGIAISFIVGLATIHYFLKFIKKMGLWTFAIYRVILAGIVYYYLV